MPLDPSDPLDGSSCGCGCGCGCPCKGPAIPQANKVSETSVRYGTGEVVLQADDLHAGGFGLPWGHTRSFASRLSCDADTGNGVNWQVAQWSYLVQQDDGSVVVMGSANNVPLVRPDPWWRLHAALQRAADLAAGHGQQRLPPRRSRRQYHRIRQHHRRFRQHLDPAGNQIAVVSYLGNNFNFAEVQRSYSSGGNTTIESFLYNYVDASQSNPQLSSVTLRRQVNGGAWVNVNQASYTYYGSGDPNGGQGDLQTVTTATWRAPPGSTRALLCTATGWVRRLPRLRPVPPLRPVRPLRLRPRRARRARRICSSSW